MIKDCSDAIEAIKEFNNKLHEIDTALCRQGGHPDQANWIVDRFLYNQLCRVQREMSSLHNSLADRQRKENNSK